MAKSKKILNFPTVLTIVRMILVVPFLICLLGGWYVCEQYINGSACPAGATEAQMPLYVLALVIFIFAALTDKIDGDYARKHKQVTDLGKFLDPLADKMLINSAFLAFVVMGVMPFWMLVVILWRDFAVDGMRMMVAAKGEVVAASIWGKAKTMTQMVTLVLLLLNLILENVTLTVIGLVLMYVVVILTVFSGVDYLVKGMKKI